MKPHAKFAERRIEVEREILTPPFPEDVEHWDDGTWSCSAASFAVMATSFRRFGFTLDRNWSFDTLYERFSFILGAACCIPLAGMTGEGAPSPAMNAYLLAVKSRDDNLIAATLPAALAEEGA